MYPRTCVNSRNFTFWLKSTCVLCVFLLLTTQVLPALAASQYDFSSLSGGESDMRLCAW